METLELQIEIVDQTRPVEQTSNRVMEYGIWISRINHNGMINIKGTIKLETVWW